MASEISEQLRDEVARRANHRCEYCLLHEDDAGFSHQLDHILSLKHAGSSTADNLAYACVLCNRHKGTDIASVEPRAGRFSGYSIPGRIAGPIISNSSASSSNHARK